MLHITEVGALILLVARERIRILLSLHNNNKAPTSVYLLVLSYLYIQKLTRSIADVTMCPCAEIISYFLWLVEFLKSKYFAFGIGPIMISFRSRLWKFLALTLLILHFPYLSKELRSIEDIAKAQQKEVSPWWWISFETWRLKVSPSLVKVWLRFAKVIWLNIILLLVDTYTKVKKLVFDVQYPGKRIELGIIENNFWSSTIWTLQI